VPDALLPAELPADLLPADLLPTELLLLHQLLHALLLLAVLLLQEAGPVQPPVPQPLLQHLLRYLLHQLLRKLLQLTRSRLLAACCPPRVIPGSDARRTEVSHAQACLRSLFWFSTAAYLVRLNRMRTPLRLSLMSLCFISALAAGLILGCEGTVERDDARSKEKAPSKEKPAESKKVEVGKNVILEVLPDKKRRVIVSSEVCLREGQLELLLCRKHTKEHEAILSADVDARVIHKALLFADAKEGSPVQFIPKYRPASGTPINVRLRYKDKDKLVTVPAQSWVKNAKDGKLLQSDWVFAGSRLVTNPLDPDKKHYLANDGDVICVSNFETALLDLPIKSPKDNADLIFIANTERIPPLETKVDVILEPVLEAKKETK
jgi:hypothetical protein